MEDDFLSLNLEYKFSSFLGSRGVDDCIKEFKAVLYSGPFAENSENEYVGEMIFKILCLDQAKDEGMDLYELFDNDEYTFRHAQSYYNFSKRNFATPLLKAYPELEWDGGKICIIETIAIIPKYRGKGIGSKAFKDLVWNFGDNCSLFMLQPYPLQFELEENRREFKQKLDLENFEKNEKKATASLTKYYHSWGFEKIKGLSDLLFYCSLYKNDTFDSIDMDDY
ncbi:GNAT family N-acetyltransferase [Pseudoflavitalea sp. G-6-1-2]|uniref:GNAT family N-acetyltransferase n=1 Tax=Pseudoflavitalea sp. G-6-1-2 TaxID=2728841 RepID=UPI001469CED9|nr:GNAT family N-acetyltransferase [Pseudoflavitalea sp. G-6-1-2]NML22052.1 GNAT family N-acetyltransferase [Pseudoflavitalea sp. G-6-1-2]